MAVSSTNRAGPSQAQRPAPKFGPPQPPRSHLQQTQHQLHRPQQLRAQIADRFALTSVWGNLQETAREALADVPKNFSAKHSIPLATQQLALHAAFRDVMTRAPSDYRDFQTAATAYLDSLIVDARNKNNAALEEWAHEVARMMASPTGVAALGEARIPDRALNDARARRGDAADPTTTPAGLQQAASALINASHRFHEKQDKLTDGAQPEAAKAALQRRLDAAHIEPAGWEYLRALGGPELEAAVWAASKELPAEAESIARTVRALAARQQMDAAALAALEEARVDLPTNALTIYHHSRESVDRPTFGGTVRALETTIVVDTADASTCRTAAALGSDEVIAPCPALELPDCAAVGSGAKGDLAPVAPSPPDDEDQAWRAQQADPQTFSGAPPVEERTQSSSTPPRQPCPNRKAPESNDCVALSDDGVPASTELASESLVVPDPSSQAVVAHGPASSASSNEPRESDRARSTAAAGDDVSATNESRSAVASTDVCPTSSRIRQDVPVAAHVECRLRQVGEEVLGNLHRFTTQASWSEASRQLKELLHLVKDSAPELGARSQPLGDFVRRFDLALDKVWHHNNQFYGNVYDVYCAFVAHQSASPAAETRRARAPTAAAPASPSLSQQAVNANSTPHPAITTADIEHQMHELELSVLPRLVDADTSEHQQLYLQQLRSLLATVASRPAFFNNLTLGGFLRAFFKVLPAVMVSAPAYHPKVLHLYERFRDVFYGE